MTGTIYMTEENTYVLLVDGKFEEVSARYLDVVETAEALGFSVSGGVTEPPVLTYK